LHRDILDFVVFYGTVFQAFSISSIRSWSHGASGVRGSNSDNPDVGAIARKEFIWMERSERRPSPAVIERLQHGRGDGEEEEEERIWTGRGKLDAVNTAARSATAEAFYPLGETPLTRSRTGDKSSLRIVIRKALAEASPNGFTDL